MLSERSVITFADYYLPGFKAGGPIRGLSNLVESLSGEFCFKIVTRDHDLGDTAAYPGIEWQKWQSVGRGRVFYLSRQQLTFQMLQRVIGQEPNLKGVYLSSMLSPFTVRCLALRRIGAIPDVPFLLCPHGEMAGSALQHKKPKKIAFLAVAKAFGLYRNVAWHATNHEEENAIRSMWGRHANVFVAANISDSEGNSFADGERLPKSAGTLRVVFLSRICQIKNLDFALKLIGRLAGNVEFSIYGPTEDGPYWSRCESITRSLPPNIRSEYKGVARPERVGAIFRQHDLFLLPTQGENFGHVIAEALAAGCPALISNNTPWRNLIAAHAGWDLPLSEPERFIEALKGCVQMTEAEHAEWREGARRFARNAAQANDAVERHRRMFSAVFGAPRTRAALAACRT